MKIPTPFAVSFSVALISFPSQDWAVANDLDSYGGFTEIKGEETGFFHTEKIDGRWWLVTPEGNAFWGMGMAHPITDFSKSAVTFSYLDDQEAWLKGSIERMRSLGYNCVWTGPYCPERLTKGYVDRALAEKVFREAKIPYVFPLPILKHRVEMEECEKRPDVFHDSFAKFVDDLIDQHVPKLKDDLWVMGYYYGLAPWTHDNYWLNDTLERLESPGRERLLQILEQRYDGNIAAFNEVYGTSFDSFGELNESGELTYPAWIKSYKSGYVTLPSTPGSKELFDDSQALLGEIMEHTYRLAYEAVRRHDQNHLIFGSYVKEASLTAENWERVAPYIDVITPQHVSKVFPIAPIVEALDKPALISDQPFGNVYPLPLLNAKSAPGAVPDHVDRLVLYDILAERISRDPHFIGVDFCAVLFDQSHEDKAYEIGQPGFYTVWGEPKEPLCRTVRSFNQKMVENLQEPYDSDEAAVLDRKFHETLARYREVIKDRKAFLLRNPVIPNQ
ncbi:MAG: hypothetical protein AAGF67_06380 [Verrucomicrobiota bacterium]